MKLEIQVFQAENDTTDYLSLICKGVSEEFEKTKKLNNKGYVDEFEQRIECIVTAIVYGLGGVVQEFNDHTVICNFAKYSRMGQSK